MSTIPPNLTDRFEDVTRDNSKELSDHRNVELGSAVRRRRRIMGLTQSNLAQTIGVRFQQIQKYECGANRMSAVVLERIAHALDTTPNDLYGLSTSQRESRLTKRPAIIAELAEAWGGLDATTRRVLEATIAAAITKPQNGMDPK